MGFTEATRRRWSTSEFQKEVLADLPYLSPEQARGQIPTAAVAAFLLRCSSATGAGEGGRRAKGQGRGADHEEKSGFPGHGRVYEEVTLNL